MPLKIKQSGGDFEMIPEGVYVARCFKIIDLGTQVVEYMGQEKLQPKIMVVWEILDDTKMADGRPFAISKTYTASLNEKSSLYKDLVAWRGKAFTADELMGFDISKLVGAYCQIQVVHVESSGKTYANINTIMATKERPEAVNENVIFDINNPDMEVFEGFSDYLKEKIRKAGEWSRQEKLPTKDISIDEKPINLDDIPF